MCTLSFCFFLSFLRSEGWGIGGGGIVYKSCFFLIQALIRVLGHNYLPVPFCQVTSAQSKNLMTSSPLIRVRN